MTNSSPHFLLIPGSWHKALVWDKVRHGLRSSGYESTAVALSSTGAIPAHADMSQDVAFIHDQTQALVDAGKDVVVVLHSYGGLPGSSALEGLSKSDRTRAGLKGGVVRIVYIMAFVVPENWQAAPPGNYDATPSWMEIDKETGMVWAKDSEEIFYNDLPPEEAQQWARELLHWSVNCSFSKTTHAAWRRIPSTFVLCTKDKSVFGDGAAEAMVTAAQASEPCALDTVDTIDAGHSPFLSQPDRLVEILVRAAQSS